jgi:hypothetical protein
VRNASAACGSPVRSAQTARAFGNPRLGGARAKRASADCGLPQSSPTHACCHSDTRLASSSSLNSDAGRAADSVIDQAHRAVGEFVVLPVSTLSFAATAKAASFSTMSAALSPIMIDGALVLPDVSVGMIEASETRSP